MAICGTIQEKFDVRETKTDMMNSSAKNTPAGLHAQLWEFNAARLPGPEAAKKLGSSAARGLSEAEALARLKRYGHNEPAHKTRIGFLEDIGRRFLNPLVVLLLCIGVVSSVFGDKISAGMIFLMAIVSVALSYAQEHKAQVAADKLNAMVRVTASVCRDGEFRERPVKMLVPGDIVSLSAGDIIPADVRILEARDLYVNQSQLTGESFPAEKFPEAADASDKSSPADLKSMAFMGSSVMSGTGRAVVVHTGAYTEFGKLSMSLSKNNVIDTAFEVGIRQFTWLMIKAILAMVVIIFIINLLGKGDLMQALIFALAVAVGLTPETLPMIVTINLSKGALDMSKKRVIVKQLDAIQNFGAMDILCTDKTGTLTMDEVVLERHCDVSGGDSEDVFRTGYMNSYYQTGLKNLLNQAVVKYERVDLHGFAKVDEIPFDFTRKLISVVVDTREGRLFISQGAPESVFARATHAEMGGKTVNFKAHEAAIKKTYSDLSLQGFRVLCVAYKYVENGQSVFSPADEAGLTVKGFMAFLDPPKPTAKHTIGELERKGITLKVITGDNELVAKKICGDIGLDTARMLTGEQIDRMTDARLQSAAENTTVFARMLPLQKERIVRLLHQNGHTVGYLGDGINDAPALKAADVGISVNNAVDVAKEAADIILLKKSLVVLGDGVAEGRKVFGNISKYIRMGSSSNFGNMISMTGASLILPFLPMAPIQILLNNFLYDLSQLSLPADSVDEDYLQQPRPWNIGLIKKFMLTLGPVSSLFDFATFAVLWFGFRASGNETFFHTGWFLESLLSQTVIIYVIRTRKVPFAQSKPSGWLVLNSLAVLLAGFLLPYTPLAGAFGLDRVPAAYYAALAGIVACYLLLAQLAKQWFVKRFGYE